MTQADQGFETPGSSTSSLSLAPGWTVIDCAKKLPFDEALSVADSALRSGMVTMEELLLVARAVRGRGAREAWRVACAASAQAANPFESVLRAIVLEFPELRVRPEAEVVARGMTFPPEGWLVLRFTWEQVMQSPSYVRSVLADLVAFLARVA